MQEDCTYLHFAHLYSMFKTFHEETDGIEYISEITIKQEERNKIAFGADERT